MAANVGPKSTIKLDIKESCIGTQCDGPNKFGTANWRCMVVKGGRLCPWTQTAENCQLWQKHSDSFTGFDDATNVFRSLCPEAAR